jgi:membrane-associated protease RseP (regulator of RpoE activity)
MLPQASMSRKLRSLHRWSVWNVGGLLTLAVFIASVGFAAPIPAPKDDTKKEDTKKSDSPKDGTKADQSKKADPRPRPGGPGGFPGGGPPGFFRQAMRLGAHVDAVSPDLADQLDLPKGQGLVVRTVVPNSAAAKAGLKTNDVLLEVNGKSVPSNVGELARQLADVKADATIDIVVLRKGKKETIKDVKLPEVKSLPSGGFPPGVPPRPIGLQPGFNGTAAVVTTIIQTGDRFILRHQEGGTIITLNGTTADGKPKIKEILVQEGGRSEKYETVDKVPEKHQDKVKNLVEIGEKAPVKSKSKTEGDKKGESP